MTRIAPRLMILLLCGTALAGCATDSGLTAGKTASQNSRQEVADITKTPPTDVESGVRQAQLLRQSGHYDEAVRTLSQLMLVASDNPGVVGEYGKTLAEMGRAQDATQFLGRAIELRSNDWTLYSALGVAYDQLGDQNSAQTAYQHALALKPSEPSVLNNFALSRLMANDPATARQLIERARLAGGASDPKIARNIDLVNRLAPVAPQTAANPAPAPVKQAAGMPQPLVALPPRIEVASPHDLTPAQSDRSTTQQAATVVMQPVPVDPLAGPVKAHSTPVTVAKAATATKAKPDKAAPKVAETAVAKAGKPVLADAKAGKPVVPAPKPAIATAPSAKPVAVATKADVTAPAAKADKPVLADAKAGKPTATVSSPTAAPSNNKPVVATAKPEKAPVAVAKTDKPATGPGKPEKATVADAKDKPVTATSKPALAANTGKTGKTPVKTADADKTKNGVPALRMASGGY